MESSRRKTWATDIFVREDWLVFTPDPGLSEEKPVGELTVGPDDNGEKAAPLEGPVPPPPPLPPPPTVAEARCDAEDGVKALDFGEERDWPGWCCCEPV